MDLFIVAIAALALILGALGRRIAGGLLSQWLGLDIGDAPARLAQACIMAALALGCGIPWWQASLVIPAVFIGTTVGMWRAMMPKSLSDAALVLVHGLGATVPLALLAWCGGYAWWPLIVAGVARVPAYFIAQMMPLNITFLGCYSYDPPPTAELISGAAFGLALVVSLLFV